MCYQDTDAVWKITGLTPTQKHLLGALAWHRNGDRKHPNYNQCNPGFELLVKETGLGLASIHRSTGQLEKKGILQVDRDPHRKKSNRYYFCWNESSTVIVESSPTEVNKEVTGKINREVEQDSNSSAAAVISSTPSQDEQRGREIHLLLGQKGKPDKSVKKLLPLLQDGSSRASVDEVLSHPLLISKLKKMDHPVSALIDSVVKDYAKNWMEKAEKLEARKSVDPAPSTPASPPTDYSEAMEILDGLDE